MVARYAGASLALFAFAASVLAGLSVGNPPLTVLSRGLIALVVFFFLGLVLGGAAQVVLNEYRAHRESDIRKQFVAGDNGVEPSANRAAAPVDGVSVGT